MKIVSAVQAALIDNAVTILSHDLADPDFESRLDGMLDLIAKATGVVDARKERLRRVIISRAQRRITTKE